MTIPKLTFEEVKQLLHEEGWDIVEDKYWEEYNRLILKKGDYSFPLQYNKVYFYPYVVEMFTSLGMAHRVPADCKLCYDQQVNHNRNKSDDAGKDSEPKN